MSREIMQQALDALKNTATRSASEQYAIEQHAIAALEAELAKPVNEFNPDWDQQAVLVERIRELEAELAKPEQPEALRLANWLETKIPPNDKTTFADVAKKLRQQHEEIKCEEKRFNDLWEKYAALVNQKPWLWLNKHCEVRPWISNRLPADPENWNAIYKLPVSREWVGLTNDEKAEAIKVCKAPWHSHAVEPLFLCTYVEQKLKDKNET